MLFVLESWILEGHLHSINKKVFFVIKHLIKNYSTLHKFSQHGQKFLESIQAYVYVKFVQ
jgi:hypothetical protein